MMISKELLLTYFYLLLYILLSSGGILYNKEMVEHKSNTASVIAAHDAGSNELSETKDDGKNTSIAKMPEPDTPKAGQLTGEASNKIFDESKMTAADQEHEDWNDDGSPEDQEAFMRELENFSRERAMEFKPPRFYGHSLNCLK